MSNTGQESFGPLLRLIRFAGLWLEWEHTLLSLLAFWSSLGLLLSRFCCCCCYWAATIFELGWRLVVAWNVGRRRRRWRRREYNQKERLCIDMPNVLYPCRAARSEPLIAISWSSRNSSIGCIDILARSGSFRLMNTVQHGYIDSLVDADSEYIHIHFKESEIYKKIYPLQVYNKRENKSERA